MREFVLIVAVVLCATPAYAQPRAEYAPFAVTRTVARTGHAIAAFEIAGAPVSIRAYGRKARARQFEASGELREARAMKQVFEGAPQPSLVTFEMRVKF